MIVFQRFTFEKNKVGKEWVKNNVFVSHFKKNAGVSKNCFFPKPIAFKGLFIPL